MRLGRLQVFENWSDFTIIVLSLGNRQVDVAKVFSRSLVHDPQKRRRGCKQYDKHGLYRKSILRSRSHEQGVVSENGK